MSEMWEARAWEEGFDLDLVGFDCAGEIEPGAPWECPFRPGCGLAVKDCPLKAQMLRVLRAPGRVQ